MNKAIKNFMLSIIISFSFLSIASYANVQEEVTKQVTDTVITSKIYGLYALDNSLNPLKIKVSTQNGIVSLEGTVENDKQFSDAIALANSVDGVKNVMADKLKITQSTSTQSDLLTEAKVEANLIKNKFLDPENVKYWSVGVKVENGNVSLSGTVDTETQRENVIFITKSTGGVKSVNADALKIKGQ